MNCQSCHFENPAGMKYCGSCGEALAKVCPQCDFENPAGFNFCGNCGSSLSQDAPIKESKSISRGPLSREEGERRHLTVVFCDLVGSTSLSHQLDPEDLQKLVKQYQDICDKVITRYEGYVAQYLGDGILVYFGFPVAHENSAHRAVSSGLGIIEAIKRFSQKIENSYGVEIAVRIGIHTGHVVISDMGTSSQSQQLALGSTPNIAARLEGLAEHNSLVVSRNTFELIEGLFQCEDLGMQHIKGVPDEMTIYKVIAENTALIRFDDQEDLDKTPMVGREQEQNIMLELWELAKKGQSHVIQLSGEPGVGKSRLLKSLIKSVASESDAWLNLHHCSPYHRYTSYYPIANILTEVVLQFKPDESPPDKISRLEGFLLQYGFDLEEYVPLMANILSINLEDTGYHPSPFSADQQKQRLVRAFITMYLERARQQSLLLVFEDLQWIDQSTLDVISELIHQAPTSNLLTVLTFRPEFEPPWRMYSHIIPIMLRKLESVSSREIINVIAKQKTLPEEIVDQLIMKTDGIPLFVEELTKMVLSSDMLIEKDNQYELARPIAELSIPSTLHDSLVARLDRMSHTKEVAQLGSVIGRDFSYELLRSASPMEESALMACLAELVDAELLSQKGYPPHSNYRFRHALIQDAAYQSLLKSQRVYFHKLIAKSALEDLPKFSSEHPEVLAYHFEKSGEIIDAITYWVKACEKAQQYQGIEELLHFISKGLTLLDQVDDEEKKLTLEFALRSYEAPTFLISKGFASTSANQAYKRIRELGIILKDREAVFRGLRGNATYELFSGNPRKGLSYGKEALEEAILLDQPDLIMEGHRLVGQTSIYTGELENSLLAFDRSLTLLKELEDTVPRLTGFDLEAFSLAQSSHVAWYLGYPDQAKKRSELALSRAVAINQPFSQAMSRFLASFVLTLRGEVETTLKMAQEGLRICEEYGFEMFANETRTLYGASLVLSGNHDEGFALIQQGIDWRSNNGMLTAHFLHTHIPIQLYHDLQMTDQGLRMVEEVLQLQQETEDELALSEIYRLRAMLVLQKNLHNPPNQIESDLEKSLVLARRQKSKSFELRAARSMAKYLMTQNENEKALASLQPVYDWFSEGMDTRDLRESNALVQTLKNITASA